MSPLSAPTDEPSSEPSSAADPACPRDVDGDGAAPTAAEPETSTTTSSSKSQGPRTVPFPDAIRNHPLFDTFFDLVDEDETHGGVATPAPPSTLASCHQLYQYISSTEHYAHAVHRAARQWIDDVRAAQAEAVATSPKAKPASSALAHRGGAGGTNSDDDTSTDTSPDSTDAHSDTLVDDALGGDPFDAYADADTCLGDEWPPHASVMCLVQ